MNEIDPEMQEMLEDLHALCEKGLQCHLMPNYKKMCVTCRAAHHLYLCYRSGVSIN